MEGIMKTSEAAFASFYKIIQKLRAPDGCPWDREQTPLTLRAHLIEEAYECVDAIDQKDTEHIKEELGDVALLVAMISSMYEESSTFTMADVLDTISEKLIRRHPHVFGETKVDSSGAVLEQWQIIKETVEGREKKDSLMDEVSRSLPPLERAYKLQKKAAKVGFDWTNADQVWDKVHEETDETRAACAEGSHDHIEEEIGDLIFSVVNIARYLKVDPMIALNRSTTKFVNRFKYIEKTMKNTGEIMSAEQFDRMDALWDEAKGKGL